MSSVETYYLIDFENVNDDGLSGSNTLGPNDHVHLFYTENAKKINLDTLNTNKPCSFSYHKVPTRKQSLDMHLVSYLGYLIGIHKEQKCKYIIVSKDTDYDNIITFWKGLEKASITRQPQIAKPKPNTKTATTSKPTTTKSNTNTSNEKCDLNNAIQQAISKAGYDRTTINNVASVVVSHYGDDKATNNIHNDLRAEYENYSDLYKIVKPIVNQFSTPSSHKIVKPININNEVQKKLSTANFANDIVNYVASLVCKHHDEKNAKQLIYRAIISKYGQAQGLNIYNHIKKSL